MNVEQLVKESGKSLSQITFQQKYIKCKKKNCSRCPHGPYWYAFYRDGSKVKSVYIGKTLPHTITINHITHILQTEHTEQTQPTHHTQHTKTYS